MTVFTCNELICRDECRDNDQSAVGASRARSPRARSVAIFGFPRGLLADTEWLFYVAICNVPFFRWPGSRGRVAVICRGLAAGAWSVVRRRRAGVWLRGR